MKMKLVRYIVTLGYAGLIFYLSSRTWPAGPKIPHLDKLVHLSIYFGLGGFVLWALRTTRFRYSSYIVYLAFLLTLLYGLSDEIHQLYVPGRECSLADLLADGLGAVLGVIVASKLAFFFRDQNQICKQGAECETDL